MAPRSLKFAAIVGITALAAALPAAALAGTVPVGDTTTAPPIAVATDTGTDVLAPATPNTSGTPSTDEYNSGAVRPPVDASSPKSTDIPPTPVSPPKVVPTANTSGGGCGASGSTCTPTAPKCTVNCTPSTACVTNCPKDDCAVIGGGQAANNSCGKADAPPTISGGGGTANVAGKASTPVAGGGGGGGQLPFTGLPIAWVIALGLAMVLGGMSFIYRAQWKAKLAARRNGR